MAVRPNLTDFSCRFDFGAFPLPVSADPTLQGIPCLSGCSQRPAASSLARSCMGGCDSESPTLAADISSEIALLETAGGGPRRSRVPGWQLQRSFERLQQRLEGRGLDLAGIERLRGRWELVPIPFHIHIPPQLLAMMGSSTYPREPIGVLIEFARRIFRISEGGVRVRRRRGRTHLRLGQLAT